MVADGPVSRVTGSCVWCRDSQVHGAACHVPQLSSSGTQTSCLPAPSAAVGLHKQVGSLWAHCQPRSPGHPIL